ncbi:N-formylglutamate amidohydrolase [Sphingomonas sp. GlSt437]|uniref:N-formylglutamate amidohydrolase n=1 Tax=Sphingomonas sp. GlSt437 TaxID=3389970 RepID=UPI003A8BDDBC
MHGTTPWFDQWDPNPPESPVVLSVQHAGRDYPPEMADQLRVPIAQLRPLEDRYVDALALAARRHETLFVQRAARAWIDLNRGERERDPKLDDGADARRTSIESHRLRSGLGLVPRRIASAGDIWRHRLRSADVDARIAACHRPYHGAIAKALNAARDRFGIAILLDIHSMPPLGTEGPVARIVFGDRFGRSAAARFVSRMESIAEAAGLRHALNTPYAGGHLLDRHGQPSANIHAIQIEWCRSLYLDAALDQPGEGLPMAARALRGMIDAVADEALNGAAPFAPHALAAE